MKPRLGILGHLSHGYQTDTKKISMVSKYFESIPYRLNEETLGKHLSGNVRISPWKSTPGVETPELRRGDQVKLESNEQ